MTPTISKWGEIISERALLFSYMIIITYQYKVQILQEGQKEIEKKIV